MDISGYENRFVAFIDILGFTALIGKIEENNNLDNPSFKAIISALNFLSEESVESNGQHDLVIYKSAESGSMIDIELGDPRINYISDCAIISTEGTFDGFKALCNKLTKFSTDLACDGIFLRGAITYGQVYHHGPILFGSAYMRAYKLEGEVAVYPRIIVDKSVFDALSDHDEEFPLCKNVIPIDSDNQRYLANFPYHYYPLYVYDWLSYLLRVKGKILYNLNLYDDRVTVFGADLKKLDASYCWKESYGYDLSFEGGSDCILKKYIWLANELNSTLLDNKDELSKENNEESVYPHGMRISPIQWNGTYWGPTEDLGLRR
ncbi:MAG: hypothetical protein QM579_01340 [Desulfovibrio sp.]|uniref:hypothetical protein n=1 Tax=Desulfovibrio sp. TaxID=885 RepID=UPI0039E26B2E